MLKFVRFNFSALIFYQRKCDTRHGSNFPFPISIYIDRVNDFIIIFGLLLNSSHHTLLMDGCIYNMNALSQRNYGALYYIFFFKVVKLNNQKRSEKRFSKRILFLRKKQDGHLFCRITHPWIVGTLWKSLQADLEFPWYWSRNEIFEKVWTRDTDITQTILWWDHESPLDSNQN